MRLWGVTALAAALAGCVSSSNQELTKPTLPAVSVQAIRQTDPVGTTRADAADDPAIWRNAVDPARSLIIGTDKKAGLYSYGMDGKVRDFVAAGALNNVDLRVVPDTAGQPMILVAASDRTDRARPRIALFKMDGQTGKLTALGSQSVFPSSRTAPAEAYGFCMGAARSEGYLARTFVVMKDGEIAEGRLRLTPSGIVSDYVRSMKVGSQSEGCVVDDKNSTLYVGEELVGIWRFNLADAQPMPQRFASVGAGDGLVDDVEGLSIVRDGSREWLLVSSQGDNAYVLFNLADAKLLGRFRISDGKIGGTSETDGLDVGIGDFGPGFETGLMVAQDGDNAPFAQNFKLVPWADILKALGL